MRLEDECLDDPIMIEKRQAQQAFAEARMRAQQSFAEASGPKAAPTCNEALLSFARSSQHGSSEAKEAGTRVSVRSLCEVMRGGPAPGEGGEGGKSGTGGGATAEPQFEALDTIAMSGLSEHVIYSIAQPISLVAGETAAIPVGTYAVRGERVLVFDPKVSSPHPHPNPNPNPRAYA